MIQNMKATPTDWLHCPINQRYWIDVDYNVWDMKKEKKVYQETFTGEYSLKDVLENRVHWNNKPTEALYTIGDWISDFAGPYEDRLEYFDQS